jgi:hypothetical protein
LAKKFKGQSEEKQITVEKLQGTKKKNYYYVSKFDWETDASIQT